MSTLNQPPQENTIDWDSMAEVFDRWLPYIHPVAEALIHIADISEGQTVLDVASGTGEPSLTLARRYHGKQVKIVGVDGAEAMSKRANQKAQAEGFSGLSFQHMKAEDLRFSNAAFDRVISRFGVMLFDDPLKGLEEMRRVLKHGGKMAIAVWGEFENLTSMHLIWETLMEALPEAERPPLPRIGRLGTPGKLETLLEEAGFEQFEVNPLLLTFRFENFESYWKINTEAGLLKEPLDLFSPSDQEKLKEKVRKLSQPFQKSGELVFKNEALLALAVK